ncbi:hypothetical protein HCN51_55575 [Nonomuraea sp. FMUSA5-5]|uniref:Uncharacterized protein n=1 Tax=Nonomuraea composti TaxID=2720023 RepID=A0ABX1BLD6_9ACTN|nr:hypothetical protein [Nonomuraea sp. FMUSA5-5]NJP98546.1 hypothetical protein [Nonomuraea sp. FMUSA5-5]
MGAVVFSGGQPESDGEPRAKPGAFAGVLVGVETFDDDVGEVRRELLVGLGARSLTGQSVGIDGLAEPVAFGGGDGAASEPVGQPSGRVGDRGGTGSAFPSAGVVLPSVT